MGGCLTGDVTETGGFAPGERPGVPKTDTGVPGRVVEVLPGVTLGDVPGLPGDTRETTG